MGERTEAQRIVIEPGGSAVVIRTPHGRSARFRSEHDALRWHDGRHAVIVPMLVAGGLAAVAKAVLDDELFVPTLLVLLAGGMVAGIVVWSRARGVLPEPTWLTWEESVRVDGRAHPLSAVWRDVGLSLTCGALLALVVFLASENPHRLDDLGVAQRMMATLVTLGFAVGVVLGLWSAVQRVRYHLARAR